MIVIAVVIKENNSSNSNNTNNSINSDKENDSKWTEFCERFPAATLTPTPSTLNPKH